MSNAMHVAKTGLNAQNRRMQVISNNLANVNTTGFKKDRANFETLLYQVLKTSGAQTTGETKNVSGFNVGTGVKIINSDKLFTQGNIVTTDNALDLAIDGGGFFQILNPDGTISPNEDKEMNELLDFVDEKMQEIFYEAEMETKRIGGKFRQPGYKAQVIKLIEKLVAGFERENR